jgi:lipoprotein-anchoring transpeptidase ErfK/SrfK
MAQTVTKKAHLAFALSVFFLASGAVEAQIPGAHAAAVSPVFWALQPAQPLSPKEVDAAAAGIRAALLREVPHATVYSPQRRAAWVSLAQSQIIGNQDLRIDHPQLLVVIDRNPAVEELALVLARPVTDADANWDVIGGVKVSTGQAGRFDHYITPTGVFLHTADILDYRAEGTFNENGIRGLGVKGMRVWDFGWQWATKGWRPDGERGQIRLEMHATDPDVLAQRIGRTASQGCIRIPDAMNHFLDRHGVLDADYEHAAVDDPRYRALLLPDRVPTPLAGDAMIVVDSSVHH